MNARFLLTVVLLVVSSHLLSGKIWIVNNNPGGAGDFANAQEAHDAATPGDTLYLVPSGTDYSLSPMSKRLHVFGAGYLLTENFPGNYSALNSKLRLGELAPEIIDDFSSGAAGSTFTGIEFPGTSPSQDITVHVSDVTFRRCRFERKIFTTKGNSEITGLTIVQCYLTLGFNANSAFGGKANFTNVLIANNFIESIGSVATMSGMFAQNIFVNGPTIVFLNSTFQNNLVLATSGFETLFDFAQNNSYSNNFFTQAEPSGNIGTNNTFSADVASYFIGLDGNTTDTQWKLKDGVAAIGAGALGEDVGMYGGSNPYVPSGIPAIPVVTQFNAPAAGSASTGLPVSITIKSNN